MAYALEKPSHITYQTGPKALASVIFFHGSGGTGESLKRQVERLTTSFTFPDIRIVYPTAPLQPYSPLDGRRTNVWFDRATIFPDVPEKIVSINKNKNLISAIIKNELDTGIPIHRIILGGFSMGGAMALHAAYRWERSIAGVFAVSSCLNYQSVVYKDLKDFSFQCLPPLLQIHGEIDELLNIQWGSKTFKELTKLGVQGKFQALPHLGHTLSKESLMMIKKWTNDTLFFDNSDDS